MPDMKLTKSEHEMFWRSHAAAKAVANAAFDFLMDETDLDEFKLAVRAIGQKYGGKQ